MIDSGRELFGVDTRKSNDLLATDGFDALKDLDATKDGKIDAADGVFANLRIWRDLNQDGISQANELTTLSANSITAIGVDFIAVRTDLGNGNVQTAAGTFTRSNGTTGMAGETNGAAANLDLVVNTFYRTFTNRITLTDQAKALPTLRGSGRVRDLNEAISLSTDLGNWVQTYIQQTTRQGQIDKLDGFIEKWADTADLKSLKAQADALSSSGVKLHYNLAGLTSGTSACDDFVRKLGVVERFMGFTYGGETGQARFTPLDASSGNVTVSLAAEQIASISLAYDRFKNDIYESLLPVTRLKSYVDILESALEADTLSFLGLESAFTQSIAANSQQGIIDLVEFVSAYGYGRLGELGWSATYFLVTQLNAASNLGAFSEELSSWTVRLAAATEHNLTGTSRPDLLVGTNAADSLYGRDGNDVLVAKGGDDYLSGGMGADTYVFGKGSGQDTVYNYDNDAVGTNADTILLGAGITTSGVALTRQFDDLIITLLGTDDSLRVQSYFNNDGASSHVVENIRFANGTIWNVDTVKSMVWAPTAGNDILYGYATNDTINGNDGNDTVYGYGGEDVLDGGAGADNLEGGNSNDTLKGGLDPDILYGGFGNDILQGNEHNDTLYGGYGDDSMQGNEHDDWLYGDDGNDTLDGGSGNDYLSGYRGADIYVFGVGSGRDTVYNYDEDAVGTNADTILLGAGIVNTDVRLTRDGDDLLIRPNGTDDSLRLQKYFNNDGASNYVVENLKFADNAVWDVATVKSKVLAPTVGNDTLYGYATNDTINGGDGDDALHGWAGNDMLEGGKGNDYLYGGLGADTYVFGLGAGRDTVYNYDEDAVGTNADTILLGAGITTNGVTLTRQLQDLLISLTGSEDALRVQNYFNNDGASNYVVENLKFADNTVWDVATVKSKVLAPTMGNDTLYGYATNDTINGGDGSDTLYGYAGDDVLSGGSGADNVQGGDGKDTIKGGAGNDTLYGGNENDSLQGDEHDDSLEGGAGADTLDGGVGNDRLIGGAGADLYLFGIGSGGDLIWEGSENISSDQDTVQFGEGIRPSDLTLVRYLTSLRITINGRSDQLQIMDFFTTDGRPKSVVERFVFADGKTWDSAFIRSAVLAPTEGDDQLHGYVSNDTISGGGGRDDILGFGGDDVIDGGNGWDLISGDDGHDKLNGGGGHDGLYGGAGNDTLDGGSENDYLLGDVGADVYLFGKGSGQDTVQNEDNDALGVNADTIQFAAGINPSDVLLARQYSEQITWQNNDLVIRIKGVDDSLRILNYFNADGKSSSVVERLRFADDTVWDYATVKSKISTTTPAGISLSGTSANDNLVGGQGPDTLAGGDGSDNLNGGAGNDLLDGGSGNDTYVFGNGSGQDTIDAFDGTADKIDVIQLGAGLLTSDVKVKRSVDDLVLSIIGSFDSLRVKNYFLDEGASGYQVEQIKFVGGEIWGVNEIKTKVLMGTNGDDSIMGYADSDSLVVGGGNDVVHAQGGDDTVDGGGDDDMLYGEDGNDLLYGGEQKDWLYGGNDADTLRGGAGDDWLDGQDGDDVFDGGEGGDYLDGGAGNDTYLFGKGSGNDGISSHDSTAGKLDVIQLGADVLATDVVLMRERDNLVLSIKNTTDTLRVYDYFKGDATAGYQVEQIKFADDTIWGINTVKNRVLTPTNNDDTIYGYASADNLSGQAGDDVVYAGSGIDTLDGGEGEDSLYGEDGDDVIRAGSQNDYLEGGSGHDSLDGGLGADTLAGGVGNDTYVFSVGDGIDVISEDDTTAGNIDVISFINVKSTGITSVARDNASGLVLRYGAADSITISSFFSSGSYQVEKFAFSDGVTWSVSAIDAIMSNGLTKLPAGGSSWTGKTNADFVFGSTSADSMVGLGGEDWLHGDGGNDTLRGGEGADYLVGGLGSDALYGDAGADTYVYNKGDGFDAIYGQRTEDTLRMKGFKSTDVTFNRQFSDIYVADASSGTSYNIVGLVRQAFDGTHEHTGVSKIVFDDKTITADDIRKAALKGTSGDDTNLRGYLTNDSIDGGQGNDSLYGEAGSDTLIGGTGADRLEGSSGNDTYVFSAGDGADVIYDNDATAGNTDVISFTNVKSTSVTSVARDATNGLVLRYGSSDAITIDSYFSSNANKVEQFGFSDGVTWSTAAINAIMSNGLTKLPSGGSSWTGQTTADFVFGSTSADSMVGLGGDDWLHGDGGNDTLRGGEGADYLVGGLGSDALYGDAGADTYVYAKGDGFDVIYGQRTEDTLRMKGFKSTDVTFNRQFSDIYVADASSGTSYNIIGLVRQAFDGTHEYSGVSQIIFDDKALTADDIRKAALKGTAGSDSNLRGYASNDTISGFEGNDSLYGEGGDDKLYAGSGDDLLEGGIGNDYLDGNKGNDTYRFSLGGGNDTIYDADNTVGNADVLDFQPGIAHDQLWFSQSGNNLLIKVIGTNDSVMIGGGAGASATYHVEQIKAGGKTLSDTQVANLIQAMASMTPPPLGQTTLTDAQRAQLAPVLAANWS